MDIPEFRQVFNPAYGGYLRAKIDEAKLYVNDETLQLALERVYEIFGEQGKRVRPYTLYLMYASAGGTKDIDAITAGIGSELLHAFALVHDDVADRGTIRHGTNTVQELVKERLVAQNVTHDVEHLSNIQAIMVGDLMLAWSFAALRDLENPHKDRISNLFQDMTVKLVCGEMIDISFPSRKNVSDQELSKRDLYKTSADTFINPMLMGAALAGKEIEYKTFCKEFGTLMGEVYQIQDDILDILGEEGTPEHSDISEHQHTFLTQHVLKNGSNQEKAALKQFFSGQTAEPANEQEVLAIVSKPEVINYAIAASNKRLAEAKRVVRDANFVKPYDTNWFNIIGFFERRFD